MKIHALRLHPKQLLKEEILHYSSVHHIKAGCIVTAVGSICNPVLRLANANGPKHFYGNFEIVSFVGTFSNQEGHFHLLLSDEQGKTIGGHLLEGCAIHTTAEVVLMEIHEFIFTREFDPSTGYSELKVEENRQYDFF